MSELNIEECGNAVIESYDIARKLKIRLDKLSDNRAIFLDSDYMHEGSENQICSAMSDLLESLKIAENNLNKLKSML